MMYTDKKRAKEKKWRISENILLFIAIILGSIGILMGMKIFRHKTKHFKFTFGIPTIMITQILLAIFLFNYI